METMNGTSPKSETKRGRLQENVTPPPHFSISPQLTSHEGSDSTQTMATASDAESDAHRSHHSNDWEEFCDKQARMAATKFVRSWKVFIALQSQFRDIDNKDLAQKFAEVFPVHLEHALRNPPNGVKVRNGIGGGGGVSTRSASADDILEAAESDEGGESPSPKVTHRPFFRRLSFKGLKKGKIFLKQHSDEVELSPHHEKQVKGVRPKARVVKVAVECVREGPTHLLAGDTQEGRPHWLKCRMALVKVAAGHMLEFYAPPKVSIVYNVDLLHTITEFRFANGIDLLPFFFCKSA